MEKKPETIRTAAAEILENAGFKGMAAEVLTEGGDIEKALTQAAAMARGTGEPENAARLSAAANLIKGLDKTKLY